MSSFLFVGLREKHKQELEDLTLFLQPFKTLKLFIVAVAQYLRRSLVYLLTHGVWLMLFIAVTVAGAVLFLSVDGPHATVCLFLVACYITIYKIHLSYEIDLDVDCALCFLLDFTY